MKVIFLDIDGVINTNHSMFGDTGSVKFYKPAILNLGKIVEATDACIVLNSSWNGPYLRGLLEANLAYCGINPKCVIGYTTKTPGGMSKNVFVTEWLRQTHHEPVDSYVIIEDVNIYDEEKQERFVEIKGIKGIDDKHVKEAIAILNNSGKGFDRTHSRIAVSKHKPKASGQDKKVNRRSNS